LAKAVNEPQYCELLNKHFAEINRKFAVELKKYDDKIDFELMRSQNEVIRLNKKIDVLNVWINTIILVVVLSILYVHSKE
jgi:hypothetical protein